MPRRMTRAELELEDRIEELRPYEELFYIVKADPRAWGGSVEIRDTARPLVRDVPRVFLYGASRPSGGIIVEGDDCVCYAEKWAAMAMKSDCPYRQAAGRRVIAAIKGASDGGRVRPDPSPRLVDAFRYGD